jgi:hypothetical protein
MRIYLTVLFVYTLHSITAFAAEQETVIPMSMTEQSAFLISSMTGLVALDVSRQMLSPQQLDFHKNSSMGVNLNIDSVREAYITEAKAGSVYNKARLIEQIGDEGARRYAQTMGYKPLFQGQVGQGRGFDQVYQKGQQVIIVEAKGGGSPLKQYHGYMQGTKEYALAVSNNTLKSSNASWDAKNSAFKVILAAENGQLVSQIVRTEHVQGTPTKTTVETIFGKLSVSTPLETLKKLSMQSSIYGAVFGGLFDLYGQLTSGQTFDSGRAITTTALSGISVYSGTHFAGNLTKEALVSNQSKIASSLTAGRSGFAGGMAASAIFSYGLYLLGYSDLAAANRSMMAGALGSAAGGLASAGVLWAITTYGTASTGAAIASLSGAAATNAALASLGGGTLAAGGLGVAGGAAILTGGAALIAIGIGGGVMYLYHLGDEKTENKRIEYLIAGVKNSL